MSFSSPCAGSGRETGFGGIGICRSRSSFIKLVSEMLCTSTIGFCERCSHLAMKDHDRNKSTNIIVPETVTNTKHVVDERDGKVVPSQR